MLFRSYIYIYKPTPLVALELGETLNPPTPTITSTPTSPHPSPHSSPLPPPTPTSTSSSIAGTTTASSSESWVNPVPKIELHVQHRCAVNIRWVRFGFRMRLSVNPQPLNLYLSYT